MRDIERIEVFLNRRHVGTVRMTPDRNRCVFEYTKTWLADGFSISPFELPLQPGLLFSKEGYFNGGFAVFEGSLPDGYGLYLLDRILRTEGASLKELTPLQRYALIGDSGMGALRYQPVLKVGSREPLDNPDFDDLQKKALDVLSEKSDHDAGLLYYNSHNSGGARPKAVYQDENGESWIVKFRHTYDPVDIGRMEYRYMQTAQECGIIIPEIKLINNRYFASRRFDIDHGHPVHMVSAAALLQNDFRIQGVDYKNLLALTGYLTQDPVQVEQMFRRMVFNVIADNKDDHAKNFSFLCRDGVWSLAPAYDLTYSPEGNNGQHATSVLWNGNPDRKTLIEAGRGIKMGEKRCLQIIQTVQEVCDRNLENTLSV